MVKRKSYLGYLFWMSILNFYMTRECRNPLSWISMLSFHMTREIEITFYLEGKK